MGITCVIVKALEWNRQLGDKKKIANAKLLGARKSIMETIYA